VGGVTIQLHDYPRYENPYVKAEFNADEVNISMGRHELSLNWRKTENQTIS
jgi:tRNA G37 N-methylase TrmD